MRAAGGGPRDRCDHSIKVKKPFHRLPLKLVHPDCRLSERRFDFHSMRVSGEKTASVQSSTSAPGPRAYLAGAPRWFWRGSRMMPWTTQEISLLIGFWPTASAAQISRRLNRSRASICGKAMRLRRGNLLPAGVQKHFEVKPVQTRPGCTTKRSHRSCRQSRHQQWMPPCHRRKRGAARCSNSITANAAGRLATYTRSWRSFAATPRCQGLPTAGTICGWRDTTGACRNPSKVAAGALSVDFG